MSDGKCFKCKSSFVRKTWVCAKCHAGYPSCNNCNPNNMKCPSCGTLFSNWKAI